LKKGKPDPVLASLPVVISELKPVGKRSVNGAALEIPEKRRS
jgi:hypothetical protein